MARHRLVYPTAHDAGTRLTSFVPQDAFDQFQTFDAYNHFDPHGAAQPPTPQSQHQPSVANTSDSHDGGSETLNSEQRQASNSDDEDMTPAQSRRKAQNRAA